MNGDLRYLAYIILADVEDGVLRGGILVTDAHGKPVEFRCTSPIRPNAVQRTLYGGTLMPHIAVELVGVPLVHAVQLVSFTEHCAVTVSLAVKLITVDPLTFAPLNGTAISTVGSNVSTAKLTVTDDPSVFPAVSLPPDELTVTTAVSSLASVMLNPSIHTV